MDNPQYYQPLSHALINPPRSSSQSQFYKTPSMDQQAPSGEQHKVVESDDDDEGMVEEQLSRTSAPPSPKPQAALHEPEPRRRGRPKGSKNRRGRISSQTVKSSPPSHQQLHATGQGTNPPQLPEVTAQNQQYYEFQWRVLNLCAEFYGAAEELVKGTPALVIAQCYQMGPSSKVDPLSMLSEAKQNCDTLLANPSRLITSPPPPMYPVVPTFYPASVPPGPMTSSGIPAGAPTMISQPQTFVVPMGNHAYYGPPPSQYPTTSYYSYPYGHPGAYYTPAVAPPPAPPPATPTAPPPTPTVSITTSVTGNSGAWSDEEIERLKSLAEEKRTNSGEIDWDDITSHWGSTRTRHQILIRATQLGLKESSSVRGVKRRRETDSNGDPTSTTPTPTPTASASAVRNPSSTPSSTPVASPSLQNQQQPSNPNSKAPAPISTTSSTSANQPWPMPVVAANTSSPVIGSSASDHRVTSYYRPRLTDPSSRPSSSTGTSQLPTVHRYMYQPNGHHSENSK
ncbi:hypothetical protein DFH05DRAFT_1494106 [Lentinula detonsa]|uniref:Myb-like domain-containing protein n=1 Tax=Lentinula detonsa TaxID=2804962 RepID=A0A9W8NZS4_9AGAR|nr:hypothetical protein DFH05DRAFT_1494106 [Lentinula detonsa]KAJ3990220.1 hypothetical protein F5890DRAFT_709646 [Lentinula detonsa]